MEAKREQAMVGLFVLIAAAGLVATGFPLTGALWSAAAPLPPGFPISRGVGPRQRSVERFESSEPGRDAGRNSRDDRGESRPCEGDGAELKFGNEKAGAPAGGFAEDLGAGQ